MRFASLALIVLYIAFVAASSCSRGPANAPRPRTDPRAAALAIFELAHAPAIGLELLDTVLDPALSGRDRQALETALAPFRDATDPRAVAEAPLPALGLTVVDLAASVPGGGEVRGSVHVRPIGDGTWRIVWIATPGGSWPSKRPGPGEGLTSSSTGR